MTRTQLARAAVGLAGALLLAGLVWRLGPLLEMLEDRAVRAALAAIVVAVWAGATGWMWWRAGRRSATLTAGLAGAEDAAAQRTAFAAALHGVSAERRRAAVIECPWYVIIGPPGAGKTTALRNAGLGGVAPVAGIGGTRNCEWWFGDRAVLIDTAGRYTTQDSDAEVDRAGWLAFLDLLRRTRPRQPLNGAIVALPLAEIAGAPSQLRQAHAEAVRRRLEELESRLGTRLPVYLLFTKADLLAGFTEFFDDLDEAGRSQVWGTTFPLPARGAPVLDVVPALSALAARLDARVVHRLAAERSPERRAALAGLPAQLASVAEPLRTFMEDAFGPSKLRLATLLRGLYLASGTQEGTPVDRLTGMLSRGFGLDQKRLPSLRPERGRSYFLHGLLAGLLPAEAMLVATRPETVRRRRLLRWGGFAGVTLAAGVSVATLLWWRADGVDRIVALQGAIGVHAADAAARPLDPVADADLARLLPLLDRARVLPFAALDGAGWGGLDPAPALGTASRTIYRHALERTLLPRLLRRLETQIAGALDQPELSYEATRVYLMLGGAGPLDAPLVRAWLALDWEATLPGPGLAPTRAALAGHVDALLAGPLPETALDGGLVAAARSRFARVPAAERVLDRIRGSAAAQALAPWQPRDAVGPVGAALFTRASGRPLEDGIPGFLTRRGLHGALLPALAPAIRAIAAESWVLGTRTGLATDAAALRILEDETVGRYEAAFQAAWDGLLADLRIVPLTSPSQAAQDLYILASPQSPMKALLRAVARETALADPPDAATVGRPSALARPGDGTAAHFRAVRELAGDADGAPVDLALRSLTDLQQVVAKLAAAPIGTVVPPGTADPTPPIRAEAARRPAPLAGWLTAIADDWPRLSGPR